MSSDDGQPGSNIESKVDYSLSKASRQVSGRWQEIQKVLLEALLHIMLDPTSASSFSIEEESGGSKSPVNVKNMHNISFWVNYREPTSTKTELIKTMQEQLDNNVLIKTPFWEGRVTKFGLHPKPQTGLVFYKNIDASTEKVYWNVSHVFDQLYADWCEQYNEHTTPTHAGIVIQCTGGTSETATFEMIYKDYTLKSIHNRLVVIPSAKSSTFYLCATLFGKGTPDLDSVPMKTGGLIRRNATFKRQPLECKDITNTQAECVTSRMLDQKMFDIMSLVSHTFEMSGPQLKEIFLNYKPGQTSISNETVRADNLFLFPGHISTEIKQRLLLNDYSDLYQPVLVKNSVASAASAASTTPDMKLFTRSNSQRAGLEVLNMFEFFYRTNATGKQRAISLIVRISLEDPSPKYLKENDIDLQESVFLQYGVQLSTSVPLPSLACKDVIRGNPAAFNNQNVYLIFTKE